MSAGTVFMKTAYLERLRKTCAVCFFSVVYTVNIKFNRILCAVKFFMSIHMQV